MQNDQAHLATLAAKMTTSSAMNPGLMLCLIVTPISLAGAVSLFHFVGPGPALLFTAIGVAPIAIACWQLVKFTNKDPDRLQRDEHVQRMFQLQHMVGLKDHDQLNLVPISGELTNNPALEAASGE